MKKALLLLLAACALVSCGPEEDSQSGVPDKAPVALPVPDFALPRPAQPLATPSPTPTPVPVRKAEPVVPTTPTPAPATKAAPAQVAIGPVTGAAIVREAAKYIGTNELPGNRGSVIDGWNKQAGVPLGSPYCGAFAGAMHKLAGASVPSGYAYTPNWSKDSHLVTWETAQPGDVVLFFYPSMGRIAHIGIIREPGATYIKTIEGNTSYDAAAGTSSDREGDGVHAKLRNAKVLKSNTRNKVARYR